MYVCMYNVYALVSCMCVYTMCNDLYALVSCVAVCAYSECPGVLIVIGEVEMEAAVSSHEGETRSHEGEGVGCSQFEYECLPSDRGCPDGQSVPSFNNCPRSVCFGKQLFFSLLYDRVYVCLS